MFPDVTAYPLHRALEILGDEHVDFYLKKSAPVNAVDEYKKHCIPEKFRVVRQSEVSDALIELVISIQD